MKKIYLLLIAVAGVLTAASCAKELVDDSAQVNPGEVTTLTLSFDKTAKTALIDGKTTWLAGDVIRIYNESGKYYQDVTVPDEDTGKADIEVEVNMKDSKYFAIYPVDAANGIDSGIPSIKISANPDGRFASANISAAETPVNGTELRMRNVTAILAIDVESNNTVEMVQVNAQNAMTGTYSVDLSGESPVLTPKSATKSATIATGAVDGTYYIAVAPGTYAEDFSVTALKGNGGYQTLTSTKSNEVAVNTILKLGKIGDNLTSGLPGEGTEANPYKISNLGEWTAFSASVNLGSSYAGKFVSLETDIEEAVKTPVGYYLSSDVQFPFGGTFLGNSHNIKLSIEGVNCKTPNYVGLFGLVSEGAVIKDLTIAGTVETTGTRVGGLAGACLGKVDDKISISNIVSDVVVTSTGETVGGVIGYAYYTDIKDIQNKKLVTGDNRTGGIVGLAEYKCAIENCTNIAEVKSTSEKYSYMYNAGTNNNVSQSPALSTTAISYGTGGIAGYLGNESSIANCSNTAPVSGLFKVGGIAGMTFWSPVSNSQNSGTITATGSFVYNIASQSGYAFGSAAGGIVGIIHPQGHVTACVNNGEVKGRGGIGGIVGQIICSSNTSSVPIIKGCVNNANITSENAYIGGTYKGTNAGTAGICGSVGQQRNYVATFNNCQNHGTIKTDGINAGGIVGSIARAGNVIGGAAGTVNGCSNDGDVYGQYYVGGILGNFYGRYGGTLTLINSVNSGKVVGTRTTDAGDCAGGILGANTKMDKDLVANISNVYNTGDVMYEGAAFVKPYVGGIVGRFIDKSNIKNVYNKGYVGPTEKGTVPALALDSMGELVGSFEGSCTLDFAYYPESGIGQACGKASTASPGKTVAEFNDKYAFNGVVTVNSKDCETLVEALNAWIGTSTAYYLWKAGAAGPEFDIN